MPSTLDPAYSFVFPDVVLYDSETSVDFVIMEPTNQLQRFNDDFSPSSTENYQRTIQQPTR